MMARMVRRLKIFVYRSMAIGENVSVGRDVHFGPFSIVSANSGLVIGDDVYIGKFCTIQCDGSIGRGSLVANSVGIVGRGDHDFRQRGVPVRRSRWIGDRSSGLPSQAVEVGEDVWIGYGAVILAPVVIGRGCIVAAGSVVKDNVSPYKVVAGNPARVVGDRFGAADIPIHEGAIEEYYSRHDFLGDS